MTADEAFLADIAARPDDDAPRLICADWLDDHGQPERADFIRTQIALSRLPEEDDRYSALEAHGRRLYVAHSRNWHPIRGRRFDRACPRFRRGFLEGVWHVKPSEYLRHAAKLLREHPVRDLHLFVDQDGWGPELARSPHLSRLTTLRVTGIPWDRVTSQDLLAVTASASLSNLRALDVFEADMDDKAFRKLIGVEGRALPIGLSHLDRLCFGEGRVTDDAVAALVASPLAGTLTQLALFSHTGTTQRYKTLCESPLWPRLEELRLADSWHEDPAPLSALTAGMGQSRLRKLCLDRLVVAGGDERGVVAEALAKASSWGPLEALNLSAMELSGAGLRTLLRCPHLAGLKRLGLNETELDDEDVGEIAACPYLSNLTHLLLGGHAPRSSSFGDDALTSLARSPFLTRLTVLDVGDGERVTEAGVRTLTHSPNVSRLRVLGVRADDAGLRAIAGSPHLGRLTTLRLTYRGHGAPTDEGVEALAHSSLLPHLTCVSGLPFYLGRVTEKGQRAILEARHIAWAGMDKSDLKSKEMRALYRARFDREYGLDFEEDDVMSMFID